MHGRADDAVALTRRLVAFRVAASTARKAAKSLARAAAPAAETPADDFPAGSISMALPDNFYFDPCDTNAGLWDPPLGPTVDDFVTGSLERGHKHGPDLPSSAEDRHPHPVGLSRPSDKLSQGSSGPVDAEPSRSVMPPETGAPG